MTNKKMLDKARALLLSVAAPHDGVDKNNDHAWRKCRRCLAVAELEHHDIPELLQAFVAEYDRLKALPAPPGATAALDPPTEIETLETVAALFVKYWLRNGGCGMCGGIPHTTTCFVGRIEASLMVRIGNDSPDMLAFLKANLALAPAPVAPQEQIDYYSKTGDVITTSKESRHDDEGTANTGTRDTSEGVEGRDRDAGTGHGGGASAARAEVRDGGLDDETCEGCGAPATHHDSEYVPLCRDCFESIPPTGPFGVANPAPVLPSPDALDKEKA